MLNHVTVTSKMIEEFSIGFINEIKSIKKSVENFKIDLSKALPDIFNEKALKVQGIYSHDKQHVMIIFNENREYEFSAKMLTGDVIDAFFPYKNYKGIGTGIKFENSNGRLKNITMKNLKPFEFFGNVDMTIDKINFNTPDGRMIEIGYGFVFSSDLFLNKLKNIKNFTNNFVSVYLEFYNENKTKVSDESSKAAVSKVDLQKLLVEMKKYFFDDDYKETDIDKFIADYPIIIRRGLGLINHISQVELHDVNNIYGQKLKPDLMGYNAIEKIWTIVDYKLARKKIVKGACGVRPSQMDDVTKLSAQLRIYRKYFDEIKHREYFEERYKYSIDEYPRAVGIIGFVDDDDRKDFNEIKNDYPHWLDIIPYNDLYARFEEYVEVANSIQ